MVCWICRNLKSRIVCISGVAQYICEECYKHYNGKIKLCVGYNGNECSNPVLGEDVDDGHIRCQECQEHFQEEDPDGICDEE